MDDDQIDASDVPPLDEGFFARAKLRMPKKKVSVTFTVDADVLEWFKAQGEDYESRLNAALRIYAEVHQESRR
jgi:uncharacterized protein (DUF4415 family)